MNSQKQELKKKYLKWAKDSPDAFDQLPFWMQILKSILIPFIFLFMMFAIITLHQHNFDWIEIHEGLTLFAIFLVAGLAGYSISRGYAFLESHYLWKRREKILAKRKQRLQDMLGRHLRVSNKSFEIHETFKLDRELKEVEKLEKAEEKLFKETTEAFIGDKATIK